MSLSETCTHSYELQFWSLFGVYVLPVDDFCATLGSTWVPFLRQSAASYFGAMLGSTMDTILRQSAPSYFRAMRGSTVDTKFPSVYVRISAQCVVRLWIQNFRQSTCVFQRNAWFDCGYKICVSLRAYFSAMLGSSANASVREDF